MRARIPVTAALAATLAAYVPQLPLLLRALAAMAGFGAAITAAGIFCRWTTPVPPEHRPSPPNFIAEFHSSEPPATAVRQPVAVFAGYSPPSAVVRPPAGVDPETGEVLVSAEIQHRQWNLHNGCSDSAGRPDRSAGAGPAVATPPPCSAPDPAGDELAVGMAVRWATSTRDGVGQIVDLGAEAAEIRPLWPCASRQVTVPLAGVTPITPHDLAEALS